MAYYRVGWLAESRKMAVWLGGWLGWMKSCVDDCRDGCVGGYFTLSSTGYGEWEYMGDCVGGWVGG